jgi:hypothetical protein
MAGNCEDNSTRFFLLTGNLSISFVFMVGYLLAYSPESCASVKLPTTNSHEKCSGPLHRVSRFPMGPITDLLAKIMEKLQYTKKYQMGR